jgi:uncharacterized protein
MGEEVPGYKKTATIRFYAELNDFLKNGRKYSPFEFSFKGNMIVKDAIESLGVPHSSVDLVLVNSQPVDFRHIIHQGDYISVYPEFESLDVSEVTSIRRKPLRITRFIIDAHLGRLARKLRMLGFDSIYENDITDEVIIQTAESEKRIILTRDKGILKSEKVTHGYYVRSTRTEEQLDEIIRKFDLESQFRPFTRCLVCNGKLAKARLPEVINELNPDTATIFKVFFRCTGCGKIFWEGSHYDRMKAFIRNLCP